MTKTDEEPQPFSEPPLSGCWAGTIFQPAIAGMHGSGAIRTSVLERFEQRAPASVMARIALEHALPSEWINAVFEEHRQRQYSRELLFSTVIELVTLVSLGLRPSLHAAARSLETLPVSIGALYDKVNRTEPAVLRALVRGSAERLAPVTAGWDGSASLPGWQLRVLDGNHLPASEKRLAPLRGHRGAALPGHTLVVYDPDGGLVTDILPCEDAHQSERAAVAGLLDSARPGQLWIADRQFCTRTVLLGWQAAQAGFLVREHGRHPTLAAEGPWRACGRTETGAVREQRIELSGAAASWRRIELTLDTPTEAGERVIRLWSNLPQWGEAGRTPSCTEYAGGSRVCSNGSRPRGTARSAASATHARRCSASPSRYWLTTSWPCCSAASSRRPRPPTPPCRSPPTTWPCKSGVATRACSSPCPPSSGRPPTTPIQQLWPST